MSAIAPHAALPAGFCQLRGACAVVPLCRAICLAKLDSSVSACDTEGICTCGPTDSDAISTCGPNVAVADSL
eukprot:4001170-Pleurochrysis_carterae.AAC.1